MHPKLITYIKIKYQEHISRAHIENIYISRAYIKTTCPEHISRTYNIPRTYIKNMYPEQISQTYKTKYIDQEHITRPYIKNIYQDPTSVEKTYQKHMIKGRLLPKQSCLLLHEKF